MINGDQGTLAIVCVESMLDVIRANCTLGVIHTYTMLGANFGKRCHFDGNNLQDVEYFNSRLLQVGVVGSDGSHMRQ